LEPRLDPAQAARLRSRLQGEELQLQRFALRETPSAPAASVELELFALEPGAQARRLGRVEARLQ
jgi:hypothetical protein